MNLATTQPKKFSYHTKILETRLDLMGHVNNAAYLELYEEARWDILSIGGISVEKIKKEQIGPVILDLSMSFKNELRNREEIIIESWFAGMKNDKIFNFEQVILNSKNQMASSIIMTIGLIDMQKRKLITPPKEWMAALSSSQI